VVRRSAARRAWGVPAGHTLKLAQYSVSAAPGAPQPTPDPWAVFDREGSGVAPVHAAAPGSQIAGRAGFADSGAAGDDPFGDWGFETTFGPGASAAEPLQASTQGVCDLTSFFKGLGLDPANVGPLSQGELQAIGQLVRTLALGVLGLHAATKAVKDDLNAEDRTMSASKDSNPLKSDGLGDTKPRYLFGGRAASAGERRQVPSTPCGSCWRSSSNDTPPRRI
jgi:hypothetical protein